MSDCARCGKETCCGDELCDSCQEEDYYEELWDWENAQQEQRDWERRRAEELAQEEARRRE